MQKSKVIALGGSNSQKSINKVLATYTANLLKNADLTIVDLNDFKLPLYGVDLETESGIPEAASQLNALIEGADGIVLSLAEHNGSYSAAFKNAFDWLSRIDQKVWKGKPMLLMATSPGGRGGASVLETAKVSFPHLGGNVVATFSLPKFHDNYSDGSIVNEELNKALLEQLSVFEDAL